jgi:hypothetical protein
MSVSPWYNRQTQDWRATTQSALLRTVTVKNGGLIEFRSPELAEGTTAEVIAVGDTPSDELRERLSDFIGNAKGGFSSAAGADEFTRIIHDEIKSLALCPSA